MMSRFSRSFAVSCILLVAAVWAYSQTRQNDGWMLIVSDDGEFSVEVPSKHRFFFDERGFSLSDGGRDLPLTKMEMLKTFVDGTLVSIERYHASKSALSRLYETDKARSGLISDGSETRSTGAKFRQVISKTDQFYAVRQYFYTKDHAYVLTTASRDGETAIMRRFLDSITVLTKPPTAVPTDAAVLSQLSPSKIEVLDLTGQPAVRPQPPTGDLLQIKKPGPNDKPSIIVGKPLAAFTDAARAARITGKVVIRLQFDEDGFIPKVAFLRSLPGGLARQTLLTALRIKFLPALKDGLPVSTSKSIEYSFDIY